MQIYRHINGSYGKGLKSYTLKLFLKTVSVKFKSFAYRPYFTTCIPRTIGNLTLRGFLLPKRYHPLRKFSHDKYLITFHVKDLPYGVGTYAQRVYDNNHRTVSFKLGSYYQWSYKQRIKKPDRT